MYRTLQPFILASSSPRRKQLLSSIGLEFTTQPADIYEAHDPSETPQEMVHRLAKEKALHIAKDNRNSFVLSADTDVFLGNKVFGKPANLQEAEQIINTLSGSTHSVMTVSCLICLEKSVEQLIASETKVTFRNLSPAEISAYVRTDSVLDKAGAYGAQGVGLSIIDRIEGSFSGVIGLDLSRTLQALLEHGVIKTHVS